MPQKITINSRSDGKFRKEVINNRPHIVTEMLSIEGDTVMNGLYYPDSEVESSYSQLDSLPAPAGHPVANGENISAFHPLAMNAFNVGGFVRSPRKEGKRVINELVFDIEAASKDDRGKEIIRRIENGERIGVSTGLNAKLVNYSGKKAVSGIKFDHVAVLLNEKPAGENTYTVNSEEVLICNMGDKPETNQPHEVNDMDKEKLVLAAIGNNANTLTGEDKDRLMSMSESEVVSAIANSAIKPEPTLEEAQKLVESKGLTVNSDFDAEGYSEFQANKAEFDTFKAEKDAARDKKIDHIVANSKLTKDDLKGSSEEYLERLSNSLVKPDYSGQGQPVTNADRSDAGGEIELHEGA